LETHKNHILILIKYFYSSTIVKDNMLILLLFEDIDSFGFRPKANCLLFKVNSISKLVIFIIDEIKIKKAELVTWLCLKI